MLSLWQLGQTTVHQTLAHGAGSGQVSRISGYMDEVFSNAAIGDDVLYVVTLAFDLDRGQPDLRLESLDVYAKWIANGGVIALTADLNRGKPYLFSRFLVGVRELRFGNLTLTDSHLGQSLTLRIRRGL